MWVICLADSSHEMSGFNFKHVNCLPSRWFTWKTSLIFIFIPRHTKYVGYIVFAFPFVCSSVHMYIRLFIRTFVRSCVRSSSRHRVKVFALKFIRPHILKTLWWISFIFGMMVDIGLKFLSAPSPSRGWPWGQGHGQNFHKKSQGQSFCVKVYKTSYFEDPLMDFIHIWHDCTYRSKVFISTIPTSYFEDPLMDFIHIWHDGGYRSKVFISTIPTPGMTLGSRSRTSNFHKKVKVFCV